MEKEIPKAKIAMVTSRSSLKREFSAGGAVFKKENGVVLWLVAESAPSDGYPEYWRLPKGWLDDTEDGNFPGQLGSGIKKATDEDIKKAALREVIEEGGVEAKIINKIGTQRYFRGKKTMKFVTYYLMEWIKDVPEGPGFETSEVKWLLADAAIKFLKYPREKEVLQKAKRILDSGLQENLI